MLPARCPRTSVLLILELCTVALWYIVSPFLPYGSCSLGTASVESHPRQVRGIDATADGPAPTTDGRQDKEDLFPRSLVCGDSVEEYKPGCPDLGTVRAETINLTKKKKYNIVMNMPPRTAAALMGSKLMGIDDSDIITMINKSRSFTAELYPDPEKGYSIEDGRCLVEYSFPFMGDHPGLINMVCLKPTTNNYANGVDALFVAQDLSGGTLGSGDQPQEIITLPVKIPIWEGSPDQCYNYEYQETYNALFNSIDQYVYDKLGSKRSIYTSDIVDMQKEEVRKKFITDFYSYITPKECLNHEDLRSYTAVRVEEHKVFKNKRVIACPSNLKDAEYEDPLLGRAELAALRSFDIYGRTNLHLLLGQDDSDIALTRAECMFEELARNSSLSAEYRLSTGHYVRIEYSKGVYINGLYPGKLLYISIDAFGSVDAVLFQGRPPSLSDINGEQDHIRAVKYGSQPYPSEIDHMIRAGGVAHQNYEPFDEWIYTTHIAGYQLICRLDDLIDSKELKPEKKVKLLVDDVYKKIFKKTWVEMILGKAGRSCKLSGLINGYSRPETFYFDRLCSSIEKSRKEFLRKAIPGIKCYNHANHPSSQHLLPIPYNRAYDSMQGPEPFYRPSKSFDVMVTTIRPVIT